MTTNQRPAINVPTEAIAAFCQRHHMRSLALFGSVLRSDFGPGSDVDVLVDFEPDKEPGLIALAGMERELSQLLGHQADLRTPQDLSRLFRDEVIQQAQVQYAR